MDCRNNKKNSKQLWVFTTIPEVYEPKKKWRQCDKNTFDNKTI